MPNFSSCLNPQGSVKYPTISGSFGIAGGSDEQNGADTVYNDGSGNATQCFCAINGSGTQTNWLRADTITDTDREIFEHEGWIYIPNGSLWGLDNSPYLAQNLSYSCSQSNNNSVSSNSNGGGSNSSSNNPPSSSNQASNGFASSNIPTFLAFTGNIVVIYSVFLVGITSLGIGFLLSKKSK